MAAVITGSTGQDGSYLCEFLLEKGYHVKCINRSHVESDDVMVEHYQGDITEQHVIKKVFDDCEKYDRVEVYNLAAHSQFDFYQNFPKHTFEVNTLGILNILETVRQSKNPDKFRVYQASSSEMFGKVNAYPQNETTPFCPRTVYGVSKLSGHLLVKNYRDTHGVHASSGILFNHESPRRGKQFVTKKIIDTLKCDTDVLKIGNLSARRDWGHARDYVESMWIMLQQDEPDDYVVSTGTSYTVREFIEITLEKMGKRIFWEGEGEYEKGVVDGKIVVEVSPQFYRVPEESLMVGDSRKIKRIGWCPKHDVYSLIQDMIS